MRQCTWVRSRRVHAVGSCQDGVIDVTFRAGGIKSGSVPFIERGIFREAANQIGIPLRVAIIEIEERVTELVNPQVVKASGEQVDWEGCLSIPGYVAEAARHEKVTVKARNRHGREFRIKGSDLLARALQHEIDHLNGILYIDHLESLDELVRVRDASDELTEEAAAGI